ncbi:hypothetical protein KAR91_31970 [Candidatus Pacearchaeota archaeon]|nr:hypothetical protein [Candidatus Pacearchaeota archaeon]
MDPVFLQARIDKIKELIVAFENAALSISTGEISQYTLDTGQSRQVVTKTNLATLNNHIDALYNRLVTLEARQTGNGSTTTVPGW